MNINELKRLESECLGDIQDPSIGPLTRWLSPILIFVDTTRMICEYHVRPEMADPPGWLHGGIRAAMISDAAAIFANVLEQKRTTVTTSMSIDFTDRVSVGEVVRTTATILKRGRSLVYMYGDMETKQGRLVASAKCTLFVLDRRL